MKKEIPILMNSDMVTATMSDIKTETRRTITPQPTNSWMKNVFLHHPYGDMYDQHGKQNFWISVGSEIGEAKCRYGKPGDILWVKENFTIDGHDFINESVSDDPRGRYVTGYYNSDKSRFACQLTKDEGEKFNKWKRKKGGHSSLFMFKSLSRIRLINQGIWVEALNDISCESSEKEGIEVRWDGADKEYRDYLAKNQEPGCWGDTYYNQANFSFQSLWKKINGEQSWIDNPWVWVIKFKRVSK